MVASRITSIDAIRGFIMMLMIFVNDLAIIKGNTVPNWMVHFSDRATGSGMTFVDLVLPAFIFIVGMSIPFSINTNRRKGKTTIQIFWHILIRTISLLFLGVMMTNGWPGSTLIGWSPPTWETLMGICAILAFCQISPSYKRLQIRQKTIERITILFHIIGFIGLIFLAFQFVGKTGAHIITLSPLHIYTGWWGILGIIGWAYFIASLIYLIFENHRTALLGCMILLLCLFAAAKSDTFSPSLIAFYVDIGATLGSQPAIAVAGMLLSTILVTPNTSSPYQRIRFTVLFAIAMALGALLLNNLYGISKNQATPSWALWASAITALLWLFFYIICDVKSVGFISKPFALAGHNVLLAYLLSAIYFSFIINIGMGDWYRSIGLIDLKHAVLRASCVSFLILFCTVMLNKIGFKLKL